MIGKLWEMVCSICEMSNNQMWIIEMKYEKAKEKGMEKENSTCVDIDSIFLRKIESYIFYSDITMKWKLWNCLMIVFSDWNYEYSNRIMLLRNALHYIFKSK